MVSSKTLAPKVVAVQVMEDLANVGGAPVKIVSWLDGQTGQRLLTSGPIDLTASFNDPRLIADFSMTTTAGASRSHAITASSGLSSSSMGGRASRASLGGQSKGAVGGIGGALGL